MLKDDHDSKNNQGLRFAKNSMVHNYYIASCMCSFLGGSLKFGLPLVSTIVTLLKEEITSLLGSVMGLHVLGEGLEDGGGSSSNWELIDSSIIVLLHTGQSGSRLGGVVDQSLLRLVLSSGE